MERIFPTDLNFFIWTFSTKERIFWDRSSLSRTLRYLLNKYWNNRFGESLLFKSLSVTLLLYLSGFNYVLSIFLMEEALGLFLVEIVL